MWIIKKLKIELDQFDQKQIELATSYLTTADLMKFKHEKSIFYKENGKFININLQTNGYGISTVLALQFIFSLFYKKSAKNNDAIFFSYKIINNHLTKDYKLSIQYISYLFKFLKNEGLIIRGRVGRNSWKTQLTSKGYEYLFGCSFDYLSNKYLLTSLNRSKCLIYEWFKLHFRVFKKFNFNEKLRKKLELIKKIILEIAIYAKETNIISKDNKKLTNKQHILDYTNYYPPEIDDNLIKTSKGNLKIEDVLTEDELGEMFG